MLYSVRVRVKAVCADVSTRLWSASLRVRAPGDRMCVKRKIAFAEYVYDERRPMAPREHACQHASRALYYRVTM